ncbi:MAG: glutamate formimidoyltransferase [Candidatus Methylomirabilia bacterium]
MEPAVLECVPNVSEGRDPRVVERLAEAIRSIPGARLADVHVDPDHHRSVFSFLGSPAAVESAALALADVALAAIDMRAHRGVHPRIGALDVLPFIPLRAIPMGEVVSIARRLGSVLGERFDLPVYFYGEAATTLARRRLARIRRGGYDGLARKLADPAWRPDAGPAHFNARSGATAVGAREVLVAFNVWLESRDLRVARAIARAIRESSGGLPGLEAMGVSLARQGVAQVSMNLLDPARTSIPRVFDLVRGEAERRGLAVTRSELVGLVPLRAFEGRSPESVGLYDFTQEKLLETHLPRD